VPRKGCALRAMHALAANAMILDMKTCGRDGWRSWAASVLLAGCASTPIPPPTYRRSMSPAQEAAAVAAAKRHPIARPEPRSLYPEEAPPPLDVEQQTTMSAPPVEGPSDESAAPVIAPSAPPSDYVDAPASPAPTDDSVWAPGYWSWSGTNYYWVAGDWLAPRPGFFYLGARWYDRGYGWQLRPGGWAQRGSGIVSYPVYRSPSHVYQPQPWPDYYRSNREPARGPAWGRPNYDSRESSPTQRSTASYPARSAPAPRAFYSAPRVGSYGAASSAVRSSSGGRVVVRGR
jgi:hypothetical protein